MKFERSIFAAAVLALPTSTTAFSLGFLQQIPKDGIPTGCVKAYNAEIASCTADDINVGCTPQCKQGLRDKATEVTTACAGLIVNSKSLLGIVQSGGLVSELCIRDRPGPSSTKSFLSITTSKPQQSTTSSRPPIVVAPSTTPLPDSPQSSTTSFDLPSSTSTRIQTTARPPASTPIAGDVDNTSTLVVPTTTRVPDSRNDGNGNGPNGSGGGSPFDVTGAGSTVSQNIGLVTSVFAIWTMLLLSR